MGFVPFNAEKLCMLFLMFGICHCGSIVEMHPILRVSFWKGRVQCNRDTLTTQSSKVLLGSLVSSLDHVPWTVKDWETTPQPDQPAVGCENLPIVVICLDKEFLV